MPLPHRYPFRWIEPAPADTPSRRRALISAAGHGSRRGTLSSFLTLEILAQASAMDAVESRDSRDTQAASDSDVARSSSGALNPGMLAAIDGARLSEALQREPLKAGDVLDVEVESRGHFGPLRKVHGRIWRRHEVIVEADLVLHAGG